MKFLLSNTPTSAHRVEMGEKGQPGAGRVKMSQTIVFDVRWDEAERFAWFLQEVKQDTSIRHEYGSSLSSPSDKPWRDFPFVLEYDPSRGPLDLFRFTRKRNGRTITMGVSTAWKLLDALTGKTERLVREE